MHARQETAEADALARTQEADNLRRRVERLEVDLLSAQRSAADLKVRVCVCVVCCVLCVVCYVCVCVCVDPLTLLTFLRS